MMAKLLLNFTTLLPFLLLMGALAQNETYQVKVGVVVDVETPVAKVWLSCLDMALTDFYTSNPKFKTRLLLRIRDSNEDIVDAASAAVDLIKNEQVEAILGPQSSSQAKFMIGLGQKSHVPILSFSATSPCLTSSTRSPYFFRAAIDDSSQAPAISSLAQNFKWREIVPIYADTTYGEGLIPYLVDSLRAVDARVPYRSVISPSATDDQIETELYKLMTMQTRVFVVHMWYYLGARLFKKANEIGMMKKGFVWIVTNDFTDLLGSLNSSVVDSMQGVLGVKTYVPRTEKLRDFEVRWRRKFRRENPETFEDEKLNAMSFRAYDSAFALALAVEKVRANNITSFVFKAGNNTNRSSDLDSLGVSTSGPRLIEALEDTRFEGIAGEFGMLNGQLFSDTFEIVNLIGVGWRRIGFWSPENGLNEKLLGSSRALGPILWPGESTVIPKGWEIPTNEKRFRIGVAVKEGFKEFVDVSDGTKPVTGFSIDVFEAALNELPYALPHDYIPFSNPDGSMAGTYAEMVYQVFLGKYDAVVSDTTIRANRSKYVDFTLPYTESGVVMVVPMKDHKRKSAWIFLQPLTWDLWLTSVCFFIFIGFVVWALEHRINPDFRGPPSHQVGTGFWFSFSTMVFAHKEIVISNTARFVVIIWVFVVLILTQSYTASLTSLLTVEQLQPTVKDFNQLLKSGGDKVGYLESSFVYPLLKESGFPDSRIVAYKSAEECDSLLSKGSANGGISAAIDESPYMKLFLAQYCSKYTTIGTIFKTAGFGFVFKKGSPLVADMSRAILKVTEGDEIKKIEDKWFKLDQSECHSDSQKPKISSNSLSLSSFWGLFLIAGVASLLSLLVFAAKFFYGHRKILLDPKDSMVKKINVAFKSFDQKDLSSHTFRKREQEVMSVSNRDGDLQNSTCPPSPSSYLLDVTGPNSPAFSRENIGPLSSGQASPNISALPTNIELIEQGHEATNSIIVTTIN